MGIKLGALKSFNLSPSAKLGSFNHKTANLAGFKNGKSVYVKLAGTETKSPKLPVPAQARPMEVNPSLSFNNSPTKKIMDYRLCNPNVNFNLDSQLANMI